jgi:hypothetical protein
VSENKPEEKEERTPPLVLEDRGIGLAKTEALLTSSKVARSGSVMLPPRPFQFVRVVFEE